MVDWIQRYEYFSLSVLSFKIIAPLSNRFKPEKKCTIKCKQHWFILLHGLMSMVPQKLFLKIHSIHRTDGITGIFICSIVLTRNWVHKTMFKTFRRIKSIQQRKPHLNFYKTHIYFHLYTPIGYNCISSISLLQIYIQTSA